MLVPLPTVKPLLALAGGDTSHKILACLRSVVPWVHLVAVREMKTSEDEKPTQWIRDLAAWIGGKATQVLDKLFAQFPEPPPIDDLPQYDMDTVSLSRPSSYLLLTGAVCFILSHSSDPNSP